MLDTIHAKRDDIHAVAKRHKAEKLWVFGSVARKEDTADSDIDFLVKFSPEAGFRDYDALEAGSSKLFGRGVDVVSSGVLRSSPRFAARVCKEAVPVWEADANNLSEGFCCAQREIDAKGWSGLRHRLIHDYANVDFGIVWNDAKGGLCVMSRSI